MWSETNPRWLLFAGEVVISGLEINLEHRRKMAAEVKGLAETIRQAKQAINKASAVATRVNTSASELVQNMAAVEDMTRQLDAANAELKGALGTITNGGPPLDDGATSSPLTLDQAASVVADANRGHR